MAVVQITACEYGGSLLFALDDKGDVWVLEGAQSLSGAKWRQLPPPPTPPPATKKP